MSLSACGYSRHTVTFDSNGGSSVPSQTVAKGDKVTKPEDPTRNGYDFVNWTYQGEEWSFIQHVVTEDMTLLANWSIINYKITYKLNGGTNASSNPSTYTVEDTIALANPSKAGYSFAGWTLNGEPISTIQAGTYGNLKLVANWSINSYNVTVTSSDENKGTVSGSGTYEYNSEVTVAATPNNGYVFNGWYSDSQLKNKVSSDAAYTFSMPDSNLSLYAKFWTQEEEEEEWNIAHGVIPTISSDGKTLTYGLYPQTIVDDNTIINELNKLTTTESNGWYLYEDEYYAKQVADPYKRSYTFSNGKNIVDGYTYWFKCEPIVWRILANDNGEYFVLSEMLIDTHCYHNSWEQRTIDGKEICPNNYKHSDIRAWLNNDFYNSAFALNTEHILTTEVDNSASTTAQPINKYACENTLDKVFLPSYQDYKNTNYGFNSDSDREAKVTDYVLARYAIQYNDCGYYCTRSPDFYIGSGVWGVSRTGYLCFDYVFEGFYIDNDDHSCVRPCLSISIS